MNDNTLYTRCPTCNTAFKVTDKLLGLAGGKVRCGACLAVFQASDYMLRPSNQAALESTSKADPILETRAETTSESSVEPEEPNTAVTAPSLPDAEVESMSVPESDAEQATLAESQIDLDLDEDPLSTELDNAQAIEPQIDTPDELNEQTVSDEIAESLPALDETDTDQETVEESFAGFDYAEESIDDDDDDESNDFDKDFIDETENLDVLSETEREAAQEYRAPDESDDFDSDEEHDLDYEQNIDAEREISVENDLENNQDSEIEISEWQDDDELADDSIEQDFDKESSDEFTETSQEDFEHEIDDDLVDTFDEDFTEEADEVTEEDYDELSEQLHDQMEETDTDPDPLDEFDEIAKDEKTGIKTQIIFAVAAILILIAIVQFWSNRQTLAWSDSWGSSVKAVCSLLPCNLQPRRDVASIKLLQRQLSPDEEKENHLDIKILLINEADFDQPYPTIKIKFSNKNGEQVSLKSFPPDEYLEGDVETLLMPSGSEVHIHFETEVTHPDALGFEFIFE